MAAAGVDPDDTVDLTGDSQPSADAGAGAQVRARRAERLRTLRARDQGLSAMPQRLGRNGTILFC
jgi:hypothetical protein